ncbi:hypothetical protein [Clostridium saudiense]|uniref:hypothetical protein n=1 Tax=Clostridium saudiense TaxID=1414720 RepID=UPI00267144C2|nr:hypothetical protein [Clostridium saudiense]
MITDNRVSKEEFERLRNDQSYVKVIINKINFFNNKVAKEVLNELIIFSKKTILKMFIHGLYIN